MQPFLLAESHADLRQQVNDLLIARQWGASLEADRTKLPGFLNTQTKISMPERSVRKPAPAFAASKDDISLMIV
jgi:hypothetical protein